MCLMIWTVFSGERCGPWASCLNPFGWLFVWTLNLICYLCETVWLALCLNPFGWLFVWTFLVTLYLNPFGKLLVKIFWLALCFYPFDLLFMWNCLVGSWFEPFWLILCLNLFGLHFICIFWLVHVVCFYLLIWNYFIFWCAYRLTCLVWDFFKTFKLTLRLCIKSL